MAVDQTWGLHPRSNESESLEDGIQGSEIFRSSPEDPAVQPGLRTNCLKGIKNQGESRAKGGGGSSDKNDKAYLGEEERLVLQGSPAALEVLFTAKPLAAQTAKNSPAMQETRVLSERTPEEGNGNPLQYSCLENPVDRGPWPATVRGVTKSQTRLTNTHCTKEHLAQMKPSIKVVGYHIIVTPKIIILIP